jgi:hypothetical protein
MMKHLVLLLVIMVGSGWSQDTYQPAPPLSFSAQRSVVIEFSGGEPNENYAGFMVWRKWCDPATIGKVDAKGRSLEQCFEGMLDDIPNTSSYYIDTTVEHGLTYEYWMTGYSLTDEGFKNYSNYSDIFTITIPDN